MEAAGLGLFMVAAGVVATVLESPAWQVRQALPDPLVRRALMGAAIGLTAIALIYSPWGQQSGAHLNPAVSVTFFFLKKISGWDTVFYCVAQVAGGLVGVLFTAWLLGDAFAHEPVVFVATVPGPAGRAVAFAGEFVIAFGLMLAVLVTSNSRRWARLTGVFAGLLLAGYILFEAPLSGMSLNPARTLASAVPAARWTAFWIYLVAPFLGMGLAALLYVRGGAGRRVLCAKLNHHTNRRCIFRCQRNDQARDERNQLPVEPAGPSHSGIPGTLTWRTQ